MLTPQPHSTTPPGPLHAVDNFKRQFAHLEGGGKGTAHLGQATSLPRERVREFQSEAAKYLQRTQHMSGGCTAGQRGGGSWLQGSPPPLAC